MSDADENREKLGIIRNLVPREADPHVPPKSDVERRYMGSSESKEPSYTVSSSEGNAVDNPEALQPPPRPLLMSRRLEGKSNTS